VKRLKVGVVGSGIGASHIEAYRALPEMYEVAALCDIDAGRGRAVAEKFAIPLLVGHLDRLLDSDLDIVDICTPSGLHQAQAIAVLAAGKHAVIEKPVAKSLAEVDAIAVAEAASAGRACPRRPPRRRPRRARRGFSPPASRRQRETPPRAPRWSAPGAAPRACRCR
jgi:predicted dehydrogenase